MIASALINIYILFITFNFGFLFFKFLSKNKLIVKSSKIPSIEVIIFTGICIVLVFLSYFSLFYKINLLATLILTIISSIVFINYCNQIISIFTQFIKDFKKIGVSFTILILFLWLNILFYTQFHPWNYDSGFYHAQAILWENSYGVVKGLANLVNTLGFNSHFFLLSSLFNFSFLDIQYYHIVNSFIFLVFTYFCIRRYLDLSYKGNNLSLLLIFLYFICFYQFAKEISSPTPNIYVGIYIWISLFLIFEKIYTNELNKLDFEFYSILIFICTLLTIKQSSLPILLAGLYFIWIFKNRTSILSIIFILSIVIIFPWIIRNVILTGYLVYPFPYLDLFNFDWKVPYDHVIEHKNWIYSWNRIMFYHWSEVKNMGFMDWFPIWFFDQTNFLDQVLFCLTLFSPFSIFLAIRANINKVNSVILIQYFLFWLISFVGVLYWFYFAPAFSKGWGFIYLCGIFPLVLLIPKQLLKLKYSKYSIVSILVILLFVNGRFPVLKYSGLSTVKKYNLLNPEKYKVPPHKVVAVNGLNIYVPLISDQCWNLPLPCSFYINDNLSLRTSYLGDGFRIDRKK
jgi:hypothetical protein